MSKVIKGLIMAFGLICATLTVYYRCETCTWKSVTASPNEDGYLSYSFGWACYSTDIDSSRGETVLLVDRRNPERYVLSTQSTMIDVMGYCGLFIAYSVLFMSIRERIVKYDEAEC